METFKRLKMYYWPYRKVFLWSLLAMLLMTAVTVVYPIILQITIDEIVLGRQYQLAAWVSLGFIAVMALKGTATFFHQYLGDMFGIKSVYRLRNSLYEKLQRLSFSYYDNAKTGDLMSRLTADVEGLRFFLSYGLAELIRFGLLVAISLSVERLLDILEKEEDITDHPLALCKQKLTGDVHFKNVSLAYGKEQTNALCNVSFEANSGKVIGLLGPTGSGKSSVTQLLTRFYSPVSGTITIDHKPITNYSLKTLRSNIGVVLQESFLFSSTIRSNISYGRPGASMEEIIEAAKRAQAHNFIMELPDGYDTMLGERGMGLSGGQKQRIAIARAICLNPSVLILDDATSAVDMQTEHSIQLALKEVMKNRTTFIVAHRISSLKHADEILVFNKGRICERGTHHELLEKGGYYKKIYDLQYRDVKMMNEPHEVG
ncbi:MULTISPECIES: ABC transporter ATP-binding protein [Bacillus]|uniref:ABC transporter ATP-binding protein n=1 Tax=Bacillus TaxID=1386 RepID=UPI000BA86681|nr:MULTISPECIES: ABC transporter ATP-binding protein [Bacillus]PAO69722.1 hypothetical protein CIK44_04670 [Bacillus sp. X2(2017)]WGE37694.1 ABC transporter ATP-binding protein [Bacillus stercoris]